MEENWRIWFDEQVKTSTMNVEKISLMNVEGWGMQDNGNFGRPDGKFFEITGVSIAAGLGREVPRWGQPLIGEVGRGVVVVFKKIGSDSFLLQAKAEPGNSPDNGYLMLNATISASESNLQAAHGGRKPLHAELIDSVVLADAIAIPQDGGKYLGKVNLYAVIRVDSDSIELGPNERWFTRGEMRKAMREGLIAEHLAQAMLTYFI